jgi:hypothetical protein
LWLGLLDGPTPPAARFYHIPGVLFNPYTELWLKIHSEIYGPDFAQNTGPDTTM